MVVNANAVNLTHLFVTIIIPDYGNICVDDYKLFITYHAQNSSSSINQTLTVSNPLQQIYTFNFRIDKIMLCRGTLFITTVAITNGEEGVSTAVTKMLLHCHSNNNNIMYDNSNNIIILCTTTAVNSQTFTSTGIRNTIIFEVNIYY